MLRDSDFCLRLLVEVIVGFCLFNLILVGITFLGHCLLPMIEIMTGWKATGFVVVLSYLGIIIELPLMAVFSVFGFLFGGGDTGILFICGIYLFYGYNIALIVCCMEFVRWIYIRRAQEPGASAPG